MIGVLRRGAIGWLAPVPFVVVALCAALAALVASCRPSRDAAAPTPQEIAVETARATISFEARAVGAALDVCDKRARAIADEARALTVAADRARGLARAAKLAEDCTTAGRLIDARLEAVDSLLDDADAAVDGRVGCVALEGVQRLRQLRELLGVDAPAIVEQAIRNALPLAALAPGGMCPRPAVST